MRMDQPPDENTKDGQTFMIAPKDYEAIFCKDKTPAKSIPLASSTAMLQTNIKRNMNNDLNNDNSNKFGNPTINLIRNTGVHRHVSKRESRRSHRSRKHRSTKDQDSGTSNNSSSSRRSLNRSRERRNNSNENHGSTKRHHSSRKQSNKSLRKDRSKDSSNSGSGSGSGSIKKSSSVGFNSRVVRHGKNDNNNNNQPKLQTQRAIPLEDQPTAMIAPADYVHIFKGQNTTQLKTAEVDINNAAAELAADVAPKDNCP